MTTQARSEPWIKVQRVWQQNHDLLRNAGSLGAATLLAVTSGFVYWIIAAREFTQSAVGYGSAAISAMLLLGTVGMFGLGTVLIGELSHHEKKGGLVAAALVASGLGSLVLGLAFPLVAELFGAHFPAITGSPARLGLFAFGVAITGATNVFDEGMIGLLRGGVQLTRNTVMSVVKLVVLPVAALLLHDAFGIGLVAAWVFGTLVSVIPSAIMLKRGGFRIFHRPDWALLRRLGKVTLAHNWLNLALQTPPRLIPVLVIVVVSPSANAAFYVAWMLASFLMMVPAHLSTVLFAIASASPELIAQKLRFVLRLSVMIGLPAMVVLALGAHLILHVFGPGYAQLATLPLLILIIAYIPELPKAQFIAVSRATGRVTRGAAVLTVAAACELTAVIIGGKLGGLNGLSFAYLGVLFVEGIVTAPTVLRAAYRRTAAGARTRAATPEGAYRAEPRAARQSYLDRQEAGLAGLMALASIGVSEGHTLDVATEVWRTGSFPAIPTDDARRRRAELRSTRTDLPTNNAIGRQLTEGASYRHRQLAGINALIALAIPAAQNSVPDRRKQQSLSTNRRNANRELGFAALVWCPVQSR